MVYPKTNLVTLLLDIATEPILIPDLRSDDADRHASFFESNIPYPNTSRIIRAWNQPPEVTWRIIPGDADKNITRVFPYKVGTYNLGANGYTFPVINTYVQELRQGMIKPENQADVEYFQKMMANVTTLVTPLLFTRIGVDKLGETKLNEAYMNVSFNHPKRDPIIMRYENVFCDDPSPYLPKSEQSEVITVSGARSQAKVVSEIKDYAPFLENIVGCDNLQDLHINFIAVHRGGILTSLISSLWADIMGISNHVIGVDAKRKHDESGDAVVGATISAPPGYTPSLHSVKIGNAFVGPYDVKNPSKRKHDVHVFFDPMLATGVSTYQAIIDYQKATNCKYEDIYVVSLFAGSYDGIDKLKELGVNVHVLGVHDQADLNSKGYIQPGLGDAGDKLFGINQIESSRDFAEKMQLMYSNLAKHMPKLQKRLFNKFNDYCLQICNIALNE